MQSRLATLVGGKPIIVQKSGHFIQLDQPRVVIKSILTVVESAKKQLANRE
jgi:hypothetical protein